MRIVRIVNDAKCSPLLFVKILVMMCFMRGKSAV